MGSVTLDRLIANLAKVAVRDGGESAARCFHNFLVAADGAAFRDTRSSSFTGSISTGGSSWGHGAFLAPYRSVRKRFDLPEEDSAWFEFDRPESTREVSAVAAAVLVRRMRYRPGIHPGMVGEVWPEQVVSFEFPDTYEVSGEEWPSDSRMLAELLSVSLGVPLLCRSCFLRLDEWVTQLDPNIAHGTYEGHGHPSDVGPKGHPIDAKELEAFTRMAKGWLKYRREHGAIDLGVRRLAGSIRGRSRVSGSRTESSMSRLPSRPCMALSLIRWRKERRDCLKGTTRVGCRCTTRSSSFTESDPRSCMPTNRLGAARRWKLPLKQQGT